MAKSRTITGGFILISFTSPTCVTVTAAEEAAVLTLTEAVPGIGGDFRGEAPGRAGRVGKATGALLATTGAGEATGVGAGAATTAAGVDTGGRTNAGGTFGAGAETTGATGRRPGTATGEGALRGGNAGGALGALAEDEGIVTGGGVEAGRGGRGAGAFATGAGAGAAAGAGTGAAGAAAAGFKVAALAWAATSFSRATS